MTNESAEKENMDQAADRQLILKIRENDESAMEELLEKYKGLVRKKARQMFLVGGDTDDLVQEGMIGLYKAVRDYNPEKETSFRTFASICIERHLYTVIKESTRKKHIPLNESILWGGMSDQEAAAVLTDAPAASAGPDPEQVMIERENIAELMAQLKKKLSSFEYEVLTRYLDGDNYLEIAACLGRSPKSIDNAIHRIKAKARRMEENL